MDWKVKLLSIEEVLESKEKFLYQDGLELKEMQGHVEIDSKAPCNRRGIGNERQNHVPILVLHPYDMQKEDGLELKEQRGCIESGKQSSF